MTMSLSAPAEDLAPDAARPAEPSWTVCLGCQRTVYLPRLVRNLHVCPHCSHHHRISASDRIDILVDPGSFEATGDHLRPVDPLGFTDSRPYATRLAESQRKTGLDDAVKFGTATIGGHRVVILAMDFAFMGGSMGSVVGEAVARAAELAAATRVPIIIVTSSGGARMQEGALALMQMAKTAQAIRRLRSRDVLSVCVLADPTFGGVTASFATLPDVLIAEKGSLIGFAGPRVIAAATREELPHGFQSAEYLHRRGLLDRVESRDDIRPTLIRLLALTQPAPGAPVVPFRDPAVRTSTGFARRPSAWDTVRLARDVARPTTLDYLSYLCDDFLELHGDRSGGDDPAIVAGLGSIDGRPAMFIGHQKGHATTELVARNFGMPHPEGYRKALRLMRLAERHRLPVVTLVDTQGAAPGVSAEDRGQAWAIAECIAGMSELAVPVVSVITGEGGSGGAIALAAGNQVLMMENAWYSVISPESCSMILYGTTSRAAAMAEALHITGPDLLQLGVVDAVIPEPADGAQTDWAAAASNLRLSVAAALQRLAGMSPEELVTDRFSRYRALGQVRDGR
jgi:acetyl-CoA carboxylase carboxyl transferase alpha subunit/acetyl-CoA carboxylase carboxyl transferase beta subunit